MHGDNFVQAKESIHFDRIKRPNFGERSAEQCFLRGVGYGAIWGRAKSISALITNNILSIHISCLLFMQIKHIII